jgi:hypothetical protein
MYRHLNREAYLVRRALIRFILYFSLFGSDRHLHEGILRRNTVHADRSTETRQWDAGGTVVVDRRIGSHPLALGIIEQRVGRQTAIALFNTILMEANLIGLAQATGRVIGLNARSPHQSIRADHQFGMSVNLQEETTTTTGGAVITNIVIGEGCVIVPYQQARLVWESQAPIPACPESHKLWTTRMCR